MEGREEESETEEGKETVSSAVTLTSTDSSSDCPDLQLEDWEDFEFITAQDLSN